MNRKPQDLEQEGDGGFEGYKAANKLVGKKTLVSE